MPHMVQYTVPARKVRKGDILVTVYADGVMAEHVREIDAKVKWVTFTTDYGTRRVKLEDEVKVQREELTEAEKAEQQRRWKLDFVVTSIKEAPEKLADAKRKLIDDLDTYSNFSGAYHAHKYEAYVGEQMTAALWREVEKVALANEIDLLEALEIVREEKTRQLLEYTRWTSRSTSMIVNATEDIHNEAIARWLRNVKMY